jgi:hypothetical protein
MTVIVEALAVRAWRLLTLEKWIMSVFISKQICYIVFAVGTVRVSFWKFRFSSFKHEFLKHSPPPPSSLMLCFHGMAVFCTYLHRSPASRPNRSHKGKPVPGNNWAKSKSKSHYDRQLVGQSVLVSGTHLGPATNFSISLRFSFRQLLFVML